MKFQKIKNFKWFKTILCLISGILIFFGFPKISIFPVAFIAIIPLIHIIETTESYKKLFKFGFITQIVAISGGFYWLTYTIKIFGHIPIIATIPIFLLFVAFLVCVFLFL